MQAVFDTVVQTGFFGAASAGDDEGTCSVGLGQLSGFADQSAAKDDVDRKKIVEVHWKSLLQDFFFSIIP